MLVRYKPTGQVGNIPDDKFDSSVFEPVQQPTQAPTAGAAPTQAPAKSNLTGNQHLDKIVGSASKGGLTSNIGSSILGFLGNMIKPETDAINNTIQQNAQIPSAKGNILQSIINAAQATGNMAKNTLFNPKVLASEASYAIPFGKGANFLTKAVLPGAGVGALQEASSDNPTTSSVVGNSALSAGVAALTHGILRIPSAVGKTGNAIEGAGNALQQDVNKIQVKPSVYGAGQEKAIQKTINDLVPGSTAQAKYENLQPTMDKLGKQIQKELTSNPQNVSLSQVKEDFLNNLKPIVRTKGLNNATAQKEINGYIGDLYNIAHGTTKDVLPNEISTENLFNLKQQVNQDYQGVAKKMQNGTPLNDREKVISAARQTLDDIIAEKHPSVKQATIQQSHLYDAADSLAQARNANHGTSILGIPIPGQLIEGAKSIVGGGLGKLGDVLQTGNAVPNPQNNPLLNNVIGQGASRIPSMINQQGNNAQSVDSTNGTQANGQPNSNQSSHTTTNDNINSQGSQVHSYEDYLAQVTETDPKQQVNRDMLSKAYATLPPLMAERVQKMFDSQQGTPEQQQLARNRQQADNTLNVIENAYNEAGVASNKPGGQARLVGKINDYLAEQGYNANLKTYNDARDALRPILAAAFGDKGVVSQAKLNYAVNLIPDAKSTPEEAKQDFQKIRSLMQLLPKGGEKATPQSPSPTSPPQQQSGGGPSSYVPILKQAAEQSGVPAPLLASVIQQESGFNPNAVSPAGAQGIAQFMPETARGMGINPMDPEQAIHGAAQYLANAYKQFGSWPLALAAYNAGGGAVQQYGGVPPYAETQNYVKNIMAMAGQ